MKEVSTFKVPFNICDRLHQALRAERHEAIADQITNAHPQELGADKIVGTGGGCQACMDPTTKHTITGFAEGAHYIDALVDAGLCYHFEDSAADCLRHHNLSDSQIEAIEHNVAQLFQIDWHIGGYDCLFHYALDKGKRPTKAKGHKATDANDELLENTDSSPASSELIIRDIGLVGSARNRVELTCEDTRDGRRLIVNLSVVSLDFV
ncbi:hypothetical protein [Marinobacter sp. F3R08]|uniref:hypothetical protein n=1 Tax=Marinobacter sp. F3R08 TaxID=2841559 RepID=UPI001C0873E1|nr:hypothetical protein [Marinobacter sp. F3R08]MBU2952183.1 hypothetical protein [Marinobacter sp. F3R08]